MCAGRGSSANKLFHLSGMDSEQPDGDLGAPRCALAHSTNTFTHTQGGEQIVWSGKDMQAIPPHPSRDLMHDILGQGRAVASSCPDWQHQICSVGNTGKVPHPSHQVLNEFCQGGSNPLGVACPAVN